MFPKIILFILAILSGYSGFSQNYTVHRDNKTYIGISGGTNFSMPVSVKDYSVLVSTPQSSGTSEKKYEPLFKNPGSRFGLYFSHSFTKKLSLVFVPAYTTSSFRYLTAYSWNDTVNGSAYAIEMLHRQKISWVSLPLAVRWDFTNGQFSPFIQAGIYANFRHKAGKTIFYDYTIDEQVDTKTADQTGEAELTKHIEKFNFGVSFGAGITYFSNYFALSLESNLRYGFRNIVNDQNRYADYTGFTTQYLDVLDQFKLLNLDIQLSIIFPIDNSISLGILRKRRY